MTKKIIVLDLDETLGYFTELSVFIDSLESMLKKTISRSLFFKILDMFAPFYLRPNIMSILRYIRDKKKSGVCSKVMIYTNNNGERRWVLSIKSYFEHKLNYKLFDRVISAYKIDNRQIEKCRSSHEKSYKDLISCGKLSRDAKICFFDDRQHPEMLNDNIFYIQVQGYKSQVPFRKLINIFQQSKIGNLLKDDNKMFYDMKKNYPSHAYGSESRQKLLPNESKYIKDYLHYFFYKF